MRTLHGESSPTKSEGGETEAVVGTVTVSNDDRNKYVPATETHDADPLEKGTLADQNNRETVSATEFIIQEGTAESHDISADSEASSNLFKNDWKRWNPVVIICAALLFAGVLVGIIVISQTSKETASESTVPSINDEKFPNINPSFSDAPPFFASKAPNANASIAPLPDPIQTLTPSKSSTLSTSNRPSTTPSKSPTQQPSLSPSIEPSESPSRSPTKAPTRHPTHNPTEAPTKYPTHQPTDAPTFSPTHNPTAIPTKAPTMAPTDAPTNDPTDLPTMVPTKIPAEAPTTVPTEAPTNIPTKTPTSFPTQLPSPSPSSKPTFKVTELPSTSPTQPKLPINDVCSDAIGPLPSDFSSNFGSIANAGVDYVTRCGDVDDSSPGVWYSTIGTGGEMMAHTCLDTSFDSKLTVLGGTCGKLECIEANDDFCGPGSSQSAVIWDSVYGEIYYVLVAGNSDFDDGSFNLVVGGRYNDECSSAVGPVVVDDSMPVIGSTIGATTNYISCDGVVNESNSVWYFVEGTGRELTVDVCENTDFSATMTILSGSCTGLECVSETAAGKCSVTWQSELSRNYYILVGGKRSSDAGNFSLQISHSGLATNDLCKDAIGPLALDGTPIEGSTALASPDTEAPFCFTAVTANGVWYFVEGNGANIKASLCGSQSYDTRISIYRGSCEDGLSDLICVKGNDDFCGKQSLVTWDSQFGITYYIHVHGYSNESGDFSLTVTSFA